MDSAYDHIQEQTYRKDNEDTTNSGAGKETKDQQPTLNAEFQDAYRAFSASPWGARIGGFLGNVVKQGESVYREAEKELTAVGQDATRGLTDLRESLISRTRSLSLVTNQPPTTATATGASTSTSTDATTPTTAKDLSSEEAMKESETVLSRLRGEAAKRLRDLQKAEDAADEALLRFGSNLRDFLKDAISVSPPTGGSGNQSNTVLFESKDAQGKRVIHTSRFDAQLHVIHTNPESFSKDPAGDEYDAWIKEFDIEKKTEAIAADLAKYPELRATMEKLVPDQIPYANFWQRYYYLRHGIESAEARRPASAEEEVGWDEDSEDEAGPSKAVRPGSTDSSTTIHPPKQNLLKPSEPRKSNDEKSQADSEASYDVVGAASGVPSQAPNSPKEPRKGEESDEEDWE